MAGRTFDVPDGLFNADGCSTRRAEPRKPGRYFYNPDYKSEARSP